MEAGALPRTTAALPHLTSRLPLIGSDQRLVSLVRSGQEEAFEALYDRHHRAILSFCRHMLGDPHEAEDAVQHTFMAAYRELAYTTKDVNLRPWLFTIARNRCYSILRARREQPTDEFDQLSTEGLASEVQRREDLRDLLGDMARLPPEQRAALVMSELEALSHAEIGDILGVRTDKVKALVYQARSALVASKTARETPCEEIRLELAEARGATLRRANLRRHLRDCDGCRQFRSQMERQRRQMRLLLPVGPSLALKEIVLGAVIGSSGAAAVGGGAVLSGAVKGGALKALVGSALAVSVGTAGTAFVVSSSVGPLHDHALFLGRLSPSVRSTSTSTVRRASQSSAHGAGRASATAAARVTMNPSPLGQYGSSSTGGGSLLSAVAESANRLEISPTLPPVAASAGTVLGSPSTTAGVGTGSGTGSIAATGGIPSTGAAGSLPATGAGSATASGSGSAAGVSSGATSNPTGPAGSGTGSTATTLGQAAGSSGAGSAGTSATSTGSAAGASGSGTAAAGSGATGTGGGRSGTSGVTASGTTTGVTPVSLVPVEGTTSTANTTTTAASATPTTATTSTTATTATTSATGTTTAPTTTGTTTGTSTATTSTSATGTATVTSTSSTPATTSTTPSPTSTAPAASSTPTGTTTPRAPSAAGTATSPATRVGTSAL